MGLLSKLEQLVTEHGSAAILRERLEALRDDVKRLEQKNKELEATHVELKKQNAEFILHFEQNQRATEFTECHGALFKRTLKGEFSETPYCPTCKGPLSLLPIASMVACTKCGYNPGFKSHQISQIVKELHAE